MQPSQIRRRILEDHARLRERFSELDEVARRILEGEAELAPRLRSLAEGVREEFLAHLDLEDAILVPALREVDAWGPERAEKLATEHREQRALLQRLLRGLADLDRPLEELALDLRRLVADLMVDMAHEEKSELDPHLLRDDIVEDDIETG